MGALLVATSGATAGARAQSKAAPICAVLKTALNGEASLSGNLNADQVLAARQQVATNLSYYAKKGPAGIRSSIKTFANAYKQLVATGRPINDQVDPNGAANQQAAINQILQNPAYPKAIRNITLYNSLHLHCNLNP